MNLKVGDKLICETEIGYFRRNEKCVVFEINKNGNRVKVTSEINSGHFNLDSNEWFYVFDYFRKDIKDSRKKKLKQIWKT